MKRTPRISETEWEVMKVLWRRAPLSSQQLIDELSADPACAGWHPNTIKTLLGRLVKKGALEFKTSGRSYLYAPRVAESECVSAASKSFLERVFGGSLQPLLAHFVENEKLSPDEIESLRKLLKKPAKKR